MCNFCMAEEEASTEEAGIEETEETESDEE